jgi:hypothetical protein
LKPVAAKNWIFRTIVRKEDAKPKAMKKRTDLAGKTRVAPRSSQLSMPGKLI